MNTKNRTRKISWETVTTKRQYKYSHWHTNMLKSYHGKTFSQKFKIIIYT